MAAASAARQQHGRCDAACDAEGRDRKGEFPARKAPAPSPSQQSVVGQDDGARRGTIRMVKVVATYLKRKPMPMKRITRPSLATWLPVRSQLLAAISQRGGVSR